MRSSLSRCLRLYGPLTTGLIPPGKLVKSDPLRPHRSRDQRGLRELREQRGSADGYCYTTRVLVYQFDIGQ